MGRKQEKEIIKHITLDELNKIIKKEEKSVRVLERLYFIRSLYKGYKIKEACEEIDITEPTGYGWLDSWNKGGYAGLVPKFSGGPKPKLGDAEREELKRLLGEKDAWTLKEVRILIKEKFNVEYSEMQVWRMLTSWNMHHAKPYVLDKRRPGDAETISKKNLILKEGDILGFVDESSQNINSNTERLWSFKELKMKKITAHLSANCVGCFMLNGIDTIEFPIHTKKEDFCQFLYDIRRNNPVNRICLILDNFATHKAKIVKEKARALDIELIYLPPYSPDLNPIEYLWKSIKRIISTSEIENKLELIEIVRDSFLGLAASLSSARTWIPRFLHDKLNLLC